jgi:HEAT repeat protein
MLNMDEDNNETWAAKLSGESPEDQIDALRQISTQEKVTGLAVTVVGLCGSSDDEIRMWSAEALEVAIEPQSSEIPGLIELLQQADDGEICYWAATLLGRLGVDAVAAVATLETCLCESMYLPARERAAWALAEIGPDASAAIPALQKAAENAPPRLKRLALQAMAAIDGEGDGDEIAA